MATAKLFNSGNSRAVRLPKEFRMAGTEVEIFRRGGEAVLREKPRTLEEAFEILASLDEFARDDSPPQSRKRL